MMLKQANNLFQQKKYEEALKIYTEVKVHMPQMARYIEINIKYAKSLLKTIEKKNVEYAFVNGALVKLYPCNQIESDGLQFKSIGEDPNFILDFDGKIMLHPGWYLVEQSMVGSRKRFIAKLYFDTGIGFNETESICLPVENGCKLDRVFRLTKPVNSVRFDPMDQTGSFRIETLTINKITDDVARSFMLQRLVDKCVDFSALDKFTAYQKINEESSLLGLDPYDHLIDLYNETYDARPGAIAYEEWIESVEKASLPSEEEVQSTIAKLQKRPLISIVMPVYNTPEIYLRACIDSVLAQSYPYWELCIADDKSTLPHVHTVLQEYEKKDERIRVKYREKNGHISCASNSALEIAQGEYIALLDHDDLLFEHALYFVVLAINQYPDAMVFYSDEDKIDSKGRRFDPHFKSDWNPDLFFSQNYVSHLGVYRRTLLETIGGFRIGVEGSQDHDLLLRCLPHIKDSEIVHIPRVLYHWRSIEGSTALSSNEKDYTTRAGLKALRDYFTVHGPTGVLVDVGLLPNTYRVRWPIPEPAPLVSLLIPTRDKKPIIEVAVRSILDKTTYSNYEILILDNGSVETETLTWFEDIQREDSRVRVLRYDGSFNFSAINNFGVRHASGSIIGLINNDVEVITPDWLTEMVSHIIRPDIGCVGAKLYYPDGRIQHAGVVIGIGGVAGHSHKYFHRNSNGYFSRLKLVQNLSAVTAACLLVRKEVYEAAGGLDERDLTVAFNDVDFCLKVREMGYRNLWTPFAELYHHESISRGHEDTPEKQSRFLKEIETMKTRWGRHLEKDPYYNPNLTRDREDFSIGLS